MPLAESVRRSAPTLHCIVGDGAGAKRRRWTAINADLRASKGRATTHLLATRADLTFYATAFVNVALRV